MISSITRALIASVITGDAAIAADELIFGEGARIDGRLTLFEEEGHTLAVPASVAPPERIDRRIVEHGRMTDLVGKSWAAVVAGLIVGALILTVLATLAGALFPRKMERLGTILAAWPLRALGAGFLAQSTLVGGAIMLGLTVIGLVLAPFALLASGLLAFCGYVSAVYLVGVWIVTRTGALIPDTFPEHAIAGLCGAALVSLLSLLPFVGWLVLLVLSFAGAGAIAIATFRPGHLPRADALRQGAAALARPFPETGRGGRMPSHPQNQRRRLFCDGDFAQELSAPGCRG